MSMSDDDAISCSAYQGQDYGQPFDCVDPYKSPSVNIYHEKYGIDSKCFFEKSAKSNQGRCYRAVCDANEKQTLFFNIRGEWLTCENEFQTHQVILGLGEFLSIISCPSLDVACPEFATFSAVPTSAPTLIPTTLSDIQVGVPSIVPREAPSLMYPSTSPSAIGTFTSDDEAYSSSARPSVASPSITFLPIMSPSASPISMPTVMPTVSSSSGHVVQQALFFHVLILLIFSFATTIMSYR
eukprot:CAMPEP_0202508210 /NCGR_PEP_ID=MMETSP1361-20130828/52133_1 /ASSEMBLY_ACC=CAM_ASM_000849 /TAXON_ID=210615 /ORGANISM="Staurosira complex sp., Strain CCMP2646" /LENGTH=239 /DNA_ID=CAMNT_0049142377 /DNA_START=46 /DNA_END=765 /DNA_ORIENTATION=-